MGNKILYLVQGGISRNSSVNNNEVSPDKNFYVITFDFEKNFGYIGKKGKNWWKLYTILGRTPMILGSPDNHYHFKTFEDCVAKLEILAKVKVEIKYIDESTEIIDNSKNEDFEYSKYIDEGSGFIHKFPSSEANVKAVLLSKDYLLTPGADYKLELFFETHFANSEKTGLKISNSVMNGLTIVNTIKNHSDRIAALEKELEMERKIIRPEDIPDFKIE